VFVHDVEGVEPSVALRLAGEYLGRHGYASEGAAPALTWRRGDSLAGLFAMGMERLGTELVLEASGDDEGTRLTLRYVVKDFGQFITATNRKFWDLEAAEVADHAAGAPADRARRDAYQIEARRDARRFVGISSLLAALLSGLILALAWSLFAPPS